MKKFLALAIVGAFAAIAMPALAADTAAPAAAPNAQQERMKACNAKAADKKLTGDPRKEFMSACLSGKDAPPAKMTQQEKMTACNAKAGEKKLTGDPRKEFMSECLKAAPAK